MSSVGLVVVGFAMVAPGQVSGGLASEFRWTYGMPVLEPRPVDGVEFISVKDPSIVRDGDRGNLFCQAADPAWGDPLGAGSMNVS